MQHPARHLRLCVTSAAAALGLCLFVPACQTETPKENKASKVMYTDLGDKQGVPEYMKGTIFELTERTNDEEYHASCYSLVGQLRNTGDSTASLQVRQWMLKKMAQHGFGSKLLPGYDKIGGETVLRDPRYAIVRVDGKIPPGARQGDTFDVEVSCLPGNKTASLSGGVLFESELYKLRGRSPDLAGVEVLALSKGPIIVNPAYALSDPTNANVQAQASLRRGIVMDGGVVNQDRAIVLRLRHPARSIARAIEFRINQRFQKEADKLRVDVMPLSYQVAGALDEGLVQVFIPKAYRGDWEHFMGVVGQMYLNGSPSFLVAKAKQLSEEAVKPNALLQEISYALEGIGQPALQYTLPLMAHPSPEVSFAMARASAFIGDDSGAAQEVLYRIAKNDVHPFQLSAIQTLGAMRVSPERNQKIREVLESRNTLARVEAYKVLVRNHDASMYSRVIKERFVLDKVPSNGEPLIVASSTGLPRIALIGPTPGLSLPAMFTAMNNRLMVSSAKGTTSKNVTIFFRDNSVADPIKMVSRPDLMELIARLGGEGAPAEDKFSFTYGEITAILQSMSQERKITATKADGQVTLVPFVFEKPRGVQDRIESAPVIEETRPNTSADATRSGTDAATVAQQ